MTTKVKRINFNLNETGEQLLEELAALKETSRSAILRSALRLLEICLKRPPDTRLALVNAEGKTVEIIHLVM